MSTTVAFPQFKADEMLVEFPFRGASEAGAITASSAAQQGQQGTARPAKRRAVWLQCFAPRVAEPPSPPRLQAGPSVSSPSSALVTRVALSSDAFLYARPNGPMRLPFEDIAGAELKWIEVGGARASKVIVSRKGGRDPLYIRGLQDPQAFVDALNKRLQEAGSAPTTATSSGGTLNTSEPAAAYTAVQPAESAGAAKQATARQLFPGQGAGSTDTTAPVGAAAGAEPGAAKATAALVNGHAHPEITPADAGDEEETDAVRPQEQPQEQPRHSSAQEQQAETAHSELASAAPQEQQAEAVTAAEAPSTRPQEQPPNRKEETAPALAASSQPVSTPPPPKQPGSTPPLGYSQSVPSTFSSTAAAATAAAAAAAARDRASTGGAGGAMTSMSPFATSPAQQSAAAAIHASPSSPSMVLAVNPHRHHQSPASVGGGGSAGGPAAEQRRVSAPGQSPLGANAQRGSTGAPQAPLSPVTAGGSVKQQERTGPPPPPPVPEDSFTDASAAWAHSGRPVVTATALSPQASTAASSAGVRYSPLPPPPVPAESYTFPPSSSAALSLPPLSASAPRFVAGGPPPPMAEDSIMMGADSGSRSQPTAASPQASIGTGPAAGAMTATPTSAPAPARGSSLIQVSSLSPALGVTAAPAASESGAETAAVAAGVGAVAGIAAAEAAARRRPAVTLEPPAWTPGQESPETTPRLQATPTSQQRSPDASSPARGLGGGGLPERRPSRSASARGSEHGSSGSPAAAASTPAAPDAAAHRALPPPQRTAQPALGLDHGSSLAATVVAPLTLIGLSAVAAMTAVAASAVASFQAAALASPGASAYSYPQPYQHPHQLRDGSHAGVHIHTATPTAASATAQRGVDGDGEVQALGREAATVAESGEGAWSVAAVARRRRPLQLSETPVRVLFSVPQAGDVEAEVEAASARVGSSSSPAPRFAETGMQTEPERVSAATSPMRPATASAVVDSPRLSESPTHRAYVHDGRPAASAGVSSLSGPAASSSPVSAELSPGADAGADASGSGPRGARDWYMTSTGGAAAEPRAGSFDLRGNRDLSLPSPTASYSSSGAVAGGSPAAAGGLAASAVAGAAAYGAGASGGGAYSHSASYSAGQYGPGSEGVSMTDSRSLGMGSPSGEAASAAVVSMSRSAPGPACAPMPAASGSPSTSSARSVASQATTSACTHGPVPPSCAFVVAAEEAAAAAALAAAASPSAGDAAAGQRGHHARLGGVGSEQSSSLSPSVSSTTVPSSIASAHYTPMASGAGSAGSSGLAAGAAAGAPGSAHTSAAASPSGAVAAAGAGFFGGDSPQWTAAQQRLLPPDDYAVSAETLAQGPATARAAAQSGGGSLSHSLSLRAGTSAGGTYASAAATASAGMSSSPRPTALPDIGFPENAEDCAWLLAPAASATVNESDGGSAPTPTASAAAAARSARSSPFNGNAVGGGVAGAGVASSSGSPGTGAVEGSARARGGGGSGTSSRRSSSGSCGGGGGGGGAGGGSDPTWAFMDEPGRPSCSAGGAGVLGSNAGFVNPAAAAPPMSPGLSEISSTAYGAAAVGNTGAGYWHSGISTASASPFGTPAKPAGATSAAAGAGAAASPAPTPFVNPLFVTPSKDARASGRSIERSDSGGDIALPLLPYGGAAAVAAAGAAAYGGGRRAGTGSGDDDGSLSYTSSAGPSTYAGSMGATGPVPGAAGGSGSAASGGAPFGTPQGPAGATLYPQLQQQQQIPAHAAWTGPPPQWPAPGLPHASPLMVLNPMYAQEQAAAASSSSAAQSAAVSPGVDAAPDPAFAATSPSQQARQQARQLPLGWGSPAFPTAGSGGGSQSTPLGWGSPTFPAAPTSPARAPQQQYPQQQPQQLPAWSTPQLAAHQQAPMLFASADSAAAAAADPHADAQAIVTPRQAGGNGGGGSLSTPKQQQFPQSWGSQLTSPMSSVQGSPNSQQAKHAAALLRNANDAVDEARTLVSRGDEAWLQHVAETLAAVQNAIDALKWQ